MHTASDLIGSGEAAHLLDIDRATLQRWVASGKVTPAAQLPGRTGARMFSRAAISALAEQIKDGSAA